jgi:hypothetical protein
MAKDDGFQDELRKVRAQKQAKQDARQAAEQKEQEALNQARAAAAQIAEQLDPVIDGRLSDLGQALQVQIDISRRSGDFSRSIDAAIKRDNGTKATINIDVYWREGLVVTSAESSETRRGSDNPALIRKRKFSPADFSRPDFDDWLKAALTAFAKRYE